MTFDGKGFAFIADFGNCEIRAVDVSTGEVTTLAGYAAPGNADGVGSQASFNFPQGVTHDGVGVVYVADTGNYNIRRIAVASATVSTLAGDSTTFGSADGTGTVATFTSPYGLAYHSLTSLLYVTDMTNHVIRTVNVQTRVVTTVAGSAGVDAFLDATGTAARFHSPAGLVIVDGFLYIADSANSRIRRMNLSNRVVSTFAGTATAGYTDGALTSAQFNTPVGLAIFSGSLVVTDSTNFVVRRLSLSGGGVTTYAGSGTGGYQDGAATDAMFGVCAGIGVNGSTVYVVDTTYNVVRQIS